MSAPPPSQKDGQQVLRYAFDDETGKLRVDAVISPPLHIDISAAAEDNIAIADQTGTNFLAVNPDGSINITDNSGSITIDGTVTANQGTNPWLISGPVTGPLTNVELRATEVITGGTYNSIEPSLASGESAPIQMDTFGNVKVSGIVAVIGDVTVDQGTSPWIIDGTVSLPTGASTSANQTNNLQTTQVVNSSGDPVAVKTLGSTPLSTDFGLETNSLMYGLTTGGGGGYVPVKVNPSGTMETSANQSGVWNINNISGTVSLPTGASTLAAQTTGNASLASIDSKLTAPLSVTGPLTDTQLRATPVPVSGSGNFTVIQPLGSALHVDVDNFPATVAVTQSTSPWVTSGTSTVSGAVTANAGTNLNTSLLALDSTVAKDASLTTINTSINTLLKPANTLAAVTTLGTITNPLPSGTNVIGHIISDSGSVVNATLAAETTKVIGTVNQGTSPWVVSGTVTANAGSNLNTSALALDSTVAKDASLTTLNTSVNTLLKPANTLNAVTTIGTITNVVHVDDNAGSLTVDNNGTFAVQATLAAETTKVIGTVNQGTSPWVTKDQTDGPVTPGTVASFSALVGGQYNSTLPTLTNTQQASLQVDASGRLITNNIIQGTTTDRSGSATAVSTQIMAANAARRFLFIQNLGNAPIYFNFTAAATVGSGSIELGQFASFVMEASFVTTEAVNIIRSGGSNLAFTAKEG